MSMLQERGASGQTEHWDEHTAVCVLGSACTFLFPDSKGTLAQRQIMVGMVGQRRRWAIYVGPTLGQPGIAMRNIRLWLV